MIPRHKAARALLRGQLGLAISLVATAIAWGFVHQTERTAQRSLDLTSEARVSPT